METKKPLFDLQKATKGLIESNNHVDWSTTPRVKTMARIIRIAQEHRLKKGLKRYPVTVRRKTI